MIDIIISNECENDDTNIYEIGDDMIEAIKSAVELCEQEESIEFDNEVSLTFVDDDEIRRLNNEYRGIDSSTDVLSFPMFEPGELKLQADIDYGYFMPIGDIVISLDTAKRQAEEYAHSLKREIVYLAVHSMYHLMGYDHMQEDEKKIMRAKEENIMNKLNLSRD